MTEWVVRFNHKIIGCKNAPAADAVAKVLGLNLDRQKSGENFEDGRCSRLSNVIAQASDVESKTWGRLYKRPFLGVDDAGKASMADFVDVDKEAFKLPYSEGCTR